MNALTQSALVAVRELWLGNPIVPLLAKSTLILLIAYLLVLALPRLSAAGKHLICTLALGSLLILPFLPFALPEWSIALFPATPREDVSELPKIWSEKLDAAAPSSQTLTKTELQQRDRSLTEVAIATLLRSVAGIDLVPSAASPAVLTNQSLTASSSEKPVSLPMSGKPVSVPLTIWMAVSALLMTRLLLGTARLFWLAREASPAVGPRWALILSEAMRDAGVGRAPRVLLSPSVTIPMVWGVVRPVVMLPREASSWPAGRLRAVLIHELAHLKRMDGLWLLTTRLVTVLYWFHPLVWVVSRRGRHECERACDDLVIDRGTQATEYAEHLLSLALPTARLPHEAATLAVSRGSQLEGRLRAILRKGRQRGELSRQGLSLSMLFAVAVIVPLATLQLVASPTHQKKAKETKKERLSSPQRSPLVSEVIEVVGEVPDEVQNTFELIFEPTEEDSNSDSTSVSFSYSTSDSDSASDSDESNKEEQSDKGESWYDRGSELHGEERYDEAIAAFKKSFDAGHRRAYSAYNAACGYALKGDSEAAFLWLDRAMAEGFDRADLLAKDSDLDSLRRDSRFTRLAARSGVKKDKLESTRDMLRELERTNSPDGQRWYKVGSRLLAMRDMETAISALGRAVSLLGYRNDSALYNLACAYAIAGNREAALLTLEKAIDGGFDDPSKLRSDSDLNNIRNDSRFAAIQKKAEALKLGPSIGDWFWEGWREAASRYETYLRSNPSSGRAWFNLGFVLHTAGQSDRAIDAWSRSLRLGYREPTSAYNLACAYAKLGQRDLAIKWLEQAEAKGFNLGDYIDHDDDLDALRSDPRFREMRDGLSHKHKSSERKKQKSQTSVDQSEGSGYGVSVNFF